MGTSSTGGAPILLYTDVESGPTAGGENNKGIYLSVFGKNFGTTGLGTRIKLFIGDVEVDRYISLGTSRGRPDIQLVSVQVGSLGNPTPGTPLPIKLTVDGVASNANLTFTVTPGRIFFVSADDPNAVDTADTTTGGTFAAPFKTLQKPGGVSLSFGITSASVGGAYGRVRAGDVIVMRQGTYRDVGFCGPGCPTGQGYFMQALNKSGCPVGTNCAQGGGMSSGPITIMGYPGEDVFIDRTNALGDDQFGGGFTSADSARQEAGYGAWFTLSNLKVESGFNDGAINTQRGELNPLGMHWRVVNNELTGFSCVMSTKCRGGAIAGNGDGNVWLGNYGHDEYDQNDGQTDLENHGVYIGGPGSYEIAYNVFSNIHGGNGIQIHAADLVDHVHIHHNLIHDIAKHGLNFAEGTHADIMVWNNVVYNVANAGVRFKDDAVTNLILANNTFVDTGLAGDTPSTGALTNDTLGAPNQFTMVNNIFVPHAGSAYTRGCCNADFSGAIGTFSNNLFFGGLDTNPATTFSANSSQSDPRFVSTLSADFHLEAQSPCVDHGVPPPVTVSNDFDVTTPRPLGGAYDMGAFER